MHRVIEKISVLLRNPAYRDAIAIGFVGLVIWFVAIEFDAHDELHELFSSHESWEFDELILAIAITGIFGFVFGIRRIHELNEQVKLRGTAEHKVSWVANHDPLTSLPNRHFLEKKCAVCSGADGTDCPEREIKAVAAIDLDGFKKVNDLLGHPGGDELLMVTATRLRMAVEDGLVIRMGGDEFTLLLYTIPKDLKAFGRMLVRKMSEPVNISGVQVKVSGSVGLALMDNNCDLSAAIRQSDMAMYSAKRNGSDAVAIFTPEMEQELLRRAECELSLRQAVKKNRIVPHYQPLIELDSGRVCGFEALARWTDKYGPGYTPDVFIPLAEDLGLIVELSEQILRRACLDAKHWPAELDLSFNISPTQLSDHLLGLRIAQILAETNFPPHRLQIEITESALAKDSNMAFRIVGDLRAAGIRVALDDFGTGYSSLSQLSQLEYDGIKIDREFISSFLHDEKQMKIIRSVIHLAKKLNIKTTAEGVETGAQTEALKEIGCDVAQGFHFAKAMPADQVKGYLAGDSSDSIPDRKTA